MQNNKKIILALNYLVSKDIFGGVDKLIISLTTKLKKQGYEVDIYFPKFKNSDTYHYQRENITVNLLEGELFSESLIPELKKKKYDLLVLHFFTPYTRYLKEYKKFVRKIMTVEHMSRPLFGKTLKRKIRDKCSYYLYSKYLDKSIHCCKYLQYEDQKDYSTHSIEKSEVIYNGIDSKNTTICLSSFRKNIKIIAIGRLVKEKGFQHLIEAMNEMKDDVFEVNICGDGNYRKELEKLVDYNNITFHGFVSNIDEMIEKSDILILPSYQEAFPFVILEALSRGKIVIATNVGGVPEIIIDKENGFLINPNNTGEIIKVLNYIKKSDISYINKKALETVLENFTFKEMISKHINAIKKEVE